MEPRYTEMPDGIHVYDEPTRGLHRSKGKYVTVEGFYFNENGEKCYLFQFDDKKTEKQYANTNGLKYFAIGLI